MSWTSSDYNKWIEIIESISRYGTAEALVHAYNEMRREGASEEDIRRMDSLHNRSFSVL